MSWRWSAAAFALASLLSSTGLCEGQELRLESVGARFGFYPFGAGSHFYQAEAFANCDLPWKWDLGRQWSLQSRLDGSLGWLGEADVNSVIGSAGPSLLLAREKLPISFEGGVSATGLSRSDFRDKDFGQLFQFTSHLGLNFDAGAGIQIISRFQHMSNAGISLHNPGLNLFMFGASYLF